MKRTRIVMLLVMQLLIVSVCMAQKTPAIPLTADSLATGNYKDVLSGFFQLAFNNLTGTKKELKFTSNPYAVMAKMNPDLLVDTSYYKYRHLRDLNFSFAGKLDSSYRFNGFSSGISYAIINRRDETVSRAFVVSAFNEHKEYNMLTDSLGAFASSVPIGQRAAFVTSVNTMLTDSTVTFNKLDTSIQRLVRKYAAQIKAVRFLKLLEQDPKLNVFKTSRLTYDSLKQSFRNRLLWTAGVSDTTYNDQFMFSNIVLSTQVLKGMVEDPTSNVGLEMDIRAAMNFMNDTLRAGRDLKRSLFRFEPGLNLVLKAKNTQQSFLEFKLSGSYIHTFSGMYKNERTDSLTLNSTLRIRIINNLWIPLEIKYDPKSGNVFGFLSVRLNFNAIQSKQEKPKS